MRKLIVFGLILALTAALFSGCKAAAPAPANGESGTVIQKLDLDLSDPADVGMNEFDSRLIAFLKESGKAKESFAVSPLSFKAALALAAAGAEGQTQEELLSVMGFSSAEEMNAWYRTVLAAEASFEQLRGDPMLQDSGLAYRVVNSVWQNEDASGSFREDYKALVEQSYGAEAHSEPGSNLTAAVNAWVSEKTNGLIPRILQNSPDCSVILVNALYLKNAWTNPFNPSQQKDFTTVDGKTVTKEFMEQQRFFRYYEDESCQIVSVPLCGDFSMVFVLGDDAGFREKLGRAEEKHVRVVLPKLNVETAFDQKELCSFLATCGCDRLFSAEAEFSPMFTAPIFVDDIIQKTKVKVDEKGLEAAAATAIILKNGSMLQPEDPVVFLADHPFSFYVLCGQDNPELLFWGQVMN